jgi:hypothetical protein
MITVVIAVEVVKRLAKKQIWIRRWVTDGRRRRSVRTGSGASGGLLFGRLLLAVGEDEEGWLSAAGLLGPKEILGMCKKKAKNGIKIKNVSTMISAGSKKKIKLVFCVIECKKVSNRRPKKILDHLPPKK